MDTHFLKAMSDVFGHEGGYSDHTSDRGGKTMFGITEKVARANGYTGPMDQLSVEEARRIYKAQYWDINRLDEIAGLSYLVAFEMFDTGVNMGVVQAGRFLQRALNAFNRGGKDYDDVKADGIVGPVTVYSLKQFLAKRGAEGAIVLTRALNCLQGGRYIDIVEADVAQEDFAYGWFKNRVTI